jgi:hypothetical protein
MTAGNRPPTGFIRRLAGDAAAKRQFLVRMIAESERQRLVAQENAVVDYSTLVPFREACERTLTAFFLPIFDIARVAILHGCEPEALASSFVGYDVRRHDLGWEIRPTTASRGGFPFWTRTLTTPLNCGILVGCSYEHARGVVEGVLTQGNNPWVWSSAPAEFPDVYRFAKQASRRTGSLWLDYSVNMMRISIMGRPDHVAQLCEAALERGNIIPPYAGLHWDESAPPPAPPPPPPRRYRYSSGRTPTPQVFERFPNWMAALDAEGPGCDETTIRPDDEQRFIGPYTVYTAATATLADGRAVPALLGQPDATFLHRGEVDLVVVHDGSRPWRVTTDGEAWAASDSGRTKRHRDPAFPIRLESRLPREATDGPRIGMTLHADGSMESEDVR